jgi:hypothetical protein
MIDSLCSESMLKSRKATPFRETDGNSKEKKLEKQGKEASQKR